MFDKLLMRQVVQFFKAIENYDNLVWEIQFKIFY